jgi:hypothetical protein
MNQFSALEKVIKDQKGLLLMAVVHESAYGPLRDLNFILLNANAKEVAHYIDEGCQELAIDIWEKTMLAARPLVLPIQMLGQFKNEPPEFGTIKEAEAYIRKKMNQNPSFQEDPFYYRKGIF